MVLGLSYGSHDTGACLIGEERIVAAVEEERLNREKRTAEFPLRSIKYCLDESGTLLSEVDCLVVPQKPILLVKKAFVAQSRMIRRLSLPAFLYDLGLARELWSLPRRIDNYGLTHQRARPRICFVDHHLAHAASAFLASPFERAAVLTIDGIGELETVTMGLGLGNKITKLRSYEFPYSIGKFYGAVCRHLGFVGPAKEGKVMGLAAYGDPTRFGSRMERLASFEPENGNGYMDLSYFDFGWYPKSPSKVSEKFTREFGPVRHAEEPLTQTHMDIAAGLQLALERAAIMMLTFLHGMTKESRLCMAGGVALNSVLNGKIREQTPFKEVFVQPAANDAGLALGGALYVHNCVLDRARISPMIHTYYGPHYSEEEVRQALEERGVSYTKSSDIAKDVATILAKGMIVGWFQGRVELGPRALGARSILADPRDGRTKDRVNAEVKHRESFRPFSPVVLEEEASEYFRIDHPSPFMLEVCEVRPEALETIPAVLHVDGTARIQTINEKQNPLYYRLVKEFSQLTGVSVLLNTSFNDSGEPIVCSPADAVACFLRTGMDTLAIGSFLALKEENSRQ